MQRTPETRKSGLIGRGLFLAALLPAGGLVWNAVDGGLGANPIESVIRGLGDWALNFLLITLAVTPLSRFTGRAWLGRFRRMFGLIALFYAFLHFVCYLWLDHFFDWGGIAVDIGKRPFIAAGFVAFLLLIPLVVTSSGAMARRLGSRWWHSIHKAIYASALLAVVHYALMVKRDLALPAAYGLVLIALFAARFVLRNHATGDRPDSLRGTSV